MPKEPQLQTVCYLLSSSAAEIQTPESRHVHCALQRCTEPISLASKYTDDIATLGKPVEGTSVQLGRA